MCQVCGIIGAVHEDSNVSTDVYTPSSAKPVATTAQIVTYLTTQWPGQVGYTRTWQNASSLTYSIPTTAPDTSTEGAGFKAMTAGQIAAAREAFELWDDLIAISLNEVTSASANISFAYSSTTSGGGNYARTWTSYFGGTDLALTKAAVWLNASTATHDTDADMFQGGYGVLTYVHEVGHTLGLSHPGVYDASLGSVTYASGALFAQDTRQHTVMSYFQAGSDAIGVDHVGANGVRAYAATPLLYDIAAIQAKYGADMTTRSGDTTYGFNSNAGRAAFDFARNANPVVAIWDGGGVDTLDVSGFMQNQRITLVAGAYSDVGAMTNNVAIAFGAVVENAIGGSGHDVIEGNAVGNALTGGAGNDTLWGGAGADTFVFGPGSGADVVQDFLVGVDKIRFEGLASTITSFASLVLTAATGGVTVGWGLTGASVFLAGVSVGQLTAADFGLSGSVAPSPAPTPPTTGVVRTGTAGSETLAGGAGADSLYGLDGDDVLIGGAGVDLMDGGGWFDRVDYSGSTAAVAIDLVNGSTGGDAAGDRFVSIERFVLTAFADRFVGTTAAEALVGGAGNDTFAGGGGADQFSGGAGADLFVFGARSGAATIWDFAAGSDKIRIDAGATAFSDLTLVQEAGGVRVSWGVAGASVLLSGRTVVQLNASDFLFGSPTAGPSSTPTSDPGVVRTGTAASETLAGGAGDDSLYGLDGDDVLIGGAGADLMDGGGWFDRVDYSASTAAVAIDLVNGSTGGDAAGDRFVSIERFVLTAFADGFVGTVGAEGVIGGAGNDTFAGGGGADQFTGGAGADLFVFGAQAGAASVWDFAAGLDRIRIDAGATAFSDLTLVQEAGGVRVSWGVAGASVLLSGRTIAQLGASDFEFSGTNSAAHEDLADLFGGSGPRAEVPFAPVEAFGLLGATALGHDAPLF